MRRTGKAIGTLAAATSLAMLGGGLALADNVQSNVVEIDGLKQRTVTAGGTGTSVTYWIERMKDAGETGNGQCDVSTGKQVTITPSVPTGVTASPSSLTFSNCGSATQHSQSITYSATTAALNDGAATSHSIPVTKSSGFETLSTSPAGFTLNVQPAPVTDPCASVGNPAAPVFTARSANSAGWFTTVPSADATSSTSGATVTYATGSGPFTATAPTLPEGTTTVTARATDGTCTHRTSDTAREFKVDTVAPTVSADQSTTDWSNATSVPSGEFTASDATSGIADADTSFQLVATAESTTSGGEVVATTVTRDVTDAAGNSTEATFSALIDRTKPVNTVTGLSRGQTYTLGAVPTAGCLTTDALSGAASQATPATPRTIGSVTTTCSGGTDLAGNDADPASVTYTVVYDFGGLQAPVNPTALNRVKAGSAVPVKFSLAGDQGMAILDGAPKAPTMSCSGTVDPIDDTETVTAGGSSLQYDGATGTYTYVWKTDRTWSGQCRQLQLKLADGTTRTATFHLTK